MMQLLIQYNVKQYSAPQAVDVLLYFDGQLEGTGVSWWKSNALKL